MDLKPLLDTLRQEQKIHESIFEAKQAERRLMLTLNPLDLLKNTEHISDLIGQAQELEQRRMALTIAAAEELGIQKSPVTLKDILAVLPPANRIELEQAGTTLKKTLLSLRHTNRHNFHVLHDSVETMRKEFDQFASTESGVYNARGSQQTSSTPGTGLNVRV